MTLNVTLIKRVVCRDWKFKHPNRKSYSIRHAKVGKNSLFSKEVLYTLFLTNFISLLLGTGVG
jgi:BCL2/adenovirus E1B protein-interacting protein 3